MTRKDIRITAKMADALGMTVEINDKQMMIMSHHRTQAALAARGLATEYGYLTSKGRFVAYLISIGSTRRAWTTYELEAATRNWLAAGAVVPVQVTSVTDAADRADAEPNLDDYAKAGRIVQSLIPGVRR